jgi:hypothetical protein
MELGAQETAEAQSRLNRTTERIREDVLEASTVLKLNGKLKVESSREKGRPSPLSPASSAHIPTPALWARHSPDPPRPSPRRPTLPGLDTEGVRSGRRPLRHEARPRRVRRCSGCRPGSQSARSIGSAWLGAGRGRPHLPPEAVVEGSVTAGGPAADCAACSERTSRRGGPTARPTTLADVNEGVGLVTGLEAFDQPDGARRGRVGKAARPWRRFAL